MGNENARRGYFVVFILVFFVVWTLRATVFYSVDLQFQPGLDRKIYSESLKILFWTVPVFLYLIFVDKTDPLAFLKLTTKPDLKQAVLPVLVLGCYFAGTLIFEHHA